MKCKQMTKAAALWELFEQAGDQCEIWYELWTKESLAHWFQTEGWKLYGRHD